MALRPLWLISLVLVAAPALAADVTVRLDSGSGFSVRDNTGAVERLRVDEATGNVSRNGALFVHTTGTGNLFVGPGAGNLGIDPFLGSSNAAFGVNALTANTYGAANVAVGFHALAGNTTGYANTAAGFGALSTNTTGMYNTAAGNGALAFNTTGDSNTAVGNRALFGNIDGYANAAFGESALYDTTSGAQNSAFGQRALAFNQTGSSNSAFGSNAMVASTTGVANSAFGQLALRLNINGSSNSAFGQGALYGNTTGSRNVALGDGAGAAQSTGNDNIYIDNVGVGGESGQIKIGTVGTHTATTVAGIHGATSAGGIAVLVNASGVLGTTTSSARFKQDVRDMGDASDLLMRLRPVVFRYTEESVGGEEAKTTQYGLIAEEVAAVAPELVAPDLEGRPYSVKYHELPALLVGEVQAQRRTIARLEARIAELEKAPLYTATPEVAR